MSDWKVCVTGVVYKCLVDGTVEILTQRRRVMDQLYDPFYDGTWEAVGETLTPGEDIVAAIHRGLREECGSTEETPISIPGVPDDFLFASERGECMSWVRPLCYLHSSGQPQPWTGPAFLVKVPHDFVPSNAMSQGEVGDYCWWNPALLLESMAHYPERFSAFDRPALRLAALTLMSSHA